jgi:ABC-type sugar transport system substrate-binding protein
MITRRSFGAAGAATLALAAAGRAGAQAKAPRLGIVAFQMSAETHARTANAAEAAAKALGWTAAIANSRGEMPVHIQQLEDLIQSKVDGVVVCMGKPVEADAQFAKAKAAGIPVVTALAGTSPHTLFDIQVNEYKVGAESALHLLGLMNYRGNLLVQRFEANVGTRIRGKVLDIVLAENTAVKVLGTHSMARTASWREDVRAGMEALLLRHKGQVNGIWASFDGQAFVIDDILQAQGVKKGEVPLVSIDGGQETFRRIRDAKSTLVASVAIPFERMGAAAVDALKKVIVDKKKRDDIVSGPYLYMDAVLVDKSNVPAEGKWPW